MANEEISVVGMNIAKMATMIWNVADMLRGFCVKQFLELHSVGTTMQNLKQQLYPTIPSYMERRQSKRRLLSI